LLACKAYISAGRFAVGGYLVRLLCFLWFLIHMLAMFELHALVKQVACSASTSSGRQIVFGEKCREMFAMTCYRRNDSEQMWMSMTSKAELGGVDRTLVRAYSRLNSMNGMYEFCQKETARPPTLILVRIEKN